MVDFGFELVEDFNLKNPFLKIRIQEIRANGTGKPIAKSKHIYQEDLLGSFKNGAKQVITILIKEEIAILRLKGIFEQIDTHPLNQIRLRKKNAYSIFVELIGLNSLYFRSKPLKMEKQPLTLLCNIIKRSDELYDCMVTFKLQKAIYHLSETDVMVKAGGNWLIKDNIFCTLDEELPFSWLEKIRERKQVIISSKEREEITLLFDSPLVQIKEETQITTQEIFPILQFKDFRGAFANLLFDYGQGNIVSGNAVTKDIIRDDNQEKAFEDDLIEAGYQAKNLGSSHYYCSIDQIPITLRLLLELGWTILNIEAKEVIFHDSIEASLSRDNEMLSLSGRIYYGSQLVPLAQICLAYQENHELLPLEGNQVALLPKAWVKKEIGPYFDQIIIENESVQIPLNRISSLDSLIQSNNHFEIKEEVKEILIGLKQEGDLLVQLPGSNFLGDLRIYQQQGVDWLSFLYRYGFHGILADDMGLGKTVQVLAFLSTIEYKKPTLIIVPTTLLYNWQRECIRFLNIEPYIHHGSDRMKDRAYLLQERVIITSYALIRIDNELFSQIDFQCIFLDEAQMIKNAYSKIARVIYGLTSQFRLSITGTPIENRIEELVSQFHFLFPSLIPFKARGQYTQKDIPWVKKRTSSFLLRRTKDQVAKDLPEKIEQVVWIKMHEEQEQLYHDTLDRFRNKLLIKTESTVKKFEIFETLLRLRQICCHPKLYDKGKQEYKSSKFDALFEDLRTIIEEGNKVLIYSQFTSMLHLIKKQVIDYGWAHCYLDGQTKDRQKEVERFQSEKSTQIFLISLKAGGVGLNLTEADYVLIYDPWWNVALEDQAINRAHRIGRKNKVIAKRYLCLESVEEKIMELKKNKYSLVQELIDETKDDFSVPYDDILDLFSL